MILKENVLFTKEECESIITYNNSNITNWERSDRKYDSQPINYSNETSWLFNKLRLFFETESGIQIKLIKDKRHIAFLNNVNFIKTIELFSKTKKIDL
jgi:hypothetical protein